MPRKKVDGKPIKRRSRGGCHSCKRLKIKCDETKPRCANCTKHNRECDYSLKLSWGGRPVRKDSKTDLTNGVVLEQISNLHKIFRPVVLEGPLQFVIENPADDDEYLVEEPRKRQKPGAGSSPRNDQQQQHQQPANADEPTDALIRQFAAGLAEAEKIEQPRLVRELSPFPDMLKDDPFYRELYYHFLNVVADVLVPVPHTFYPQNPFRTVLPRLALNTPHLLSLILAYSASHRAKYLNLPEPDETMRSLLSTTFEGLTRSLKNEEEAQSDTTLATAILLASYEILCLGVSPSWRTHLLGAREIVMARGITNSWTLNGRPEAVAPYHPNRLISTDIKDDNASYFLLRTFAYIDVVAALCSRNASSVLFNNQDVAQWSCPMHHIEGGQVDLMLGVELNLIPVFSKVAALVRKRMLENLSDADEQSINEEATQLSASLMSVRADDDYVSACNDYEAQLRIMNAAFSFAVLIHLYKRVLLLPSDSQPVQGTVKLITDLLGKLPESSGIIACLSFVIVTAGCEAIDEETRSAYRKWTHILQRFGAGHLYKAKDITELCWATGKNWIDLAAELGWDLAFL